MPRQYVDVGSRGRDAPVDVLPCKIADVIERSWIRVVVRSACLAFDFNDSAIGQSGELLIRSGVERNLGARAGRELDAEAFAIRAHQCRIDDTTLKDSQRVIGYRENTWG